MATDYIPLIAIPDSIVETVCFKLKEKGIIPTVKSLDAASSSCLISNILVAKDDIVLAAKTLEIILDKGLNNENDSMGIAGNVLIPVDFSEASTFAVALGIKFAAALGLRPLLINTYLTNYAAEIHKPFGIAGFYETASAADPRQAAEYNMRLIVAAAMEEIRRNNLPSTLLSTRIIEGIAEDVILEASRNHNVELVIMPTRDSRRRENEANGSITAEVLDSIRRPMLTVPESTPIEDPADVENVLVMCWGDSRDNIVFDTYYRIFNAKAPNIHLVAIPKADGAPASGLLESHNSLSAKYPAAKFSVDEINPADFQQSFTNLIQQENIQLVVVPNRRRRVLSRIFNPGIAHRLLFAYDITMLAVPI